MTDPWGFMEWWQELLFMLVAFLPFVLGYLASR